MRTIRMQIYEHTEYSNEENISLYINKKLAKNNLHKHKLSSNQINIPTQVRNMIYCLFYCYICPPNSKLKVDGY